MNTPPAGMITQLPRTYERATAASAIAAGDLLVRDTAGKVAPMAAAGDFIVGVATQSVDADDDLVMLVEGEATFRARTGASWAAGRKIRSAAGSQVDEGAGELHHMGRLIRHDTDDDTAYVAVSLGRAQMNGSGQVEHDVDFGSMIHAKQYALLMGL